MVGTSLSDIEGLNVIETSDKKKKGIIKRMTEMNGKDTFSKVKNVLAGDIYTQGTNVRVVAPVDGEMKVFEGILQGVDADKKMFSENYFEEDTALSADDLVTISKDKVYKITKDLKSTMIDGGKSLYDYLIEDGKAEELGIASEKWEEQDYLGMTQSEFEDLENGDGDENGDEDEDDKDFFDEISDICPVMAITGIFALICNTIVGVGVI